MRFRLRRLRGCYTPFCTRPLPRSVKSWQNVSVKECSVRCWSQTWPCRVSQTWARMKKTYLRLMADSCPNEQGKNLWKWLTRSMSSPTSTSCYTLKTIFSQWHQPKRASLTIRAAALSKTTGIPFTSYTIKLSNLNPRQSPSWRLRRDNWSPEPASLLRCACASGWSCASLSSRKKLTRSSKRWSLRRWWLTTNADSDFKSWKKNKS